VDSDRFEDFLSEFSRRDFLKRAGGAAGLAMLLGSGLEVLAACGGGSQTQAPTAGHKGGHLIEVWHNDIATFNTLNYSSTVDLINSGFTFDSLLTTQTGGELVPLLAKTMPKTSSDGRTYTFDLRRDVNWTDGQQLTSDDVAFTYNLLIDPQYSDFISPQRGEFSTYVQSVTNPDKFTVVFTLKGVYAPFLVNFMQWGVLPKHVLGSMSAKELNTAAFFKGPTVTSGVFKFVKWDKGQQITLARNDGYHRGAALVDTYVYKVVGNTQETAISLKNSEADLGVADPAFFDQLKAASNLNTTILDIPLMYYFGFQLDPSKPASRLFSDKSVRQALLYALDRQKFISAVFFNLAKVTDTFEPKSSWAYDPKQVKFPFDKAKAEQMLDAAGWKKGSDGIRAKEGVKMQFELIVNNNNVRINMVNAMQQMWKDVGVAFQPKVVDGNDWIQRWRISRNFDMLLMATQWGQDPDQSNIWASRNAAVGGSNAMGYKNTALDGVLHDAVSVLDQNKRKDLYFKMQEILAEDLPAAPLVTSQYVWAYNKRVHNIKFGPFSQWNQRPWFKDVWVEQATG